MSNRGTYLPHPVFIVMVIIQSPVLPAFLYYRTLEVYLMAEGTLFLTCFPLFFYLIFLQFLTFLFITCIFMLFFTLGIPIL